MPVAWPTFQDWRAQNQVFEYFGIYPGDRPTSPAPISPTS